jgi:hypothetical protein
MVLKDSTVSQNIFRVFVGYIKTNEYKFWYTANYSKYPSKFRGNFCPARGNTGVTSVRYSHLLWMFLCSWVGVVEL